MEIKCPYNARECSLQNGVENVDFLEQSADGLHLKQTHVYYYQVQAQIHICQKSFADFVVWTTKGIFIQRIKPHQEFFSHAMNKVNAFYTNAVLPEVLCKWYSRQRMATVDDSETQPNAVSGSIKWCYCGLEEDDPDIEGACMIGCDNQTVPNTMVSLVLLRVGKCPKR